MLLKICYFKIIIIKRKLFQLLLFFNNYLTSKKINKNIDANISNILIIRLQRLGDLIMTESVVRSLSKRYPNVPIDIITAKNNAKLKPLFSNSIRTFYYYSSKKYHNNPSTSLERKEILKLPMYDLIIDFDGDYFSLKIAKKNNPKRYLSRGAFRISEYIKKNQKCKNQFELLYKIADLKPHSLPNTFSIIQKKMKRIEIHPFALARIKYPDDEFYYNLLVKMKSEFPYHSKMLTGYGNELKKTRKLSKETGIPIYTNENDPLGIEFRRNISLVITPDTFTMHFAAYLKTPVIALFGPQTPERYAANYPNVYPIYYGVYCSPCDYSNFGLDFCPNNNLCINSIKVEDVIQKAKEIIENQE